MKRTRSPSPPSNSQRRKLIETELKPDHSTAIVKTKTIKALQGIELHPLLSSNVTGSTSVVSVTAAPLKENPFLAHWNTKSSSKKRHERIPHVDRHLATEPSSHRPRPIKFNAPGKFVAKAEADRAAAQIRQLEKEILDVTEELEGEVDVAIVADILRSNEVVEAEWWDVPFIRSDNNIKFSLAHDIIGNLVQRPSLKMQSMSKMSDSSQPTDVIYLTPEERKKLRRQRRLEAQKELQEKIALGLIPPPPAKVKLSSLPRMLAQPGNALGDESVLDPTRIAAEIRAQGLARHATHQQSNAERKLTEEERAIKNFRKFAELDAEEVHQAVFKLNDRLEDGAKRFKVLINAEQNHLHGRSITTPNFTLIVVEGGPKGIKRYSRLLLERVDPSDPTWAQLLWTGTLTSKSTKLTDPNAGKPFQMKVFEKNFEAIEYLKRWDYSHFWSLASTSSE